MEIAKWRSIQASIAKLLPATKIPLYQSLSSAPAGPSELRQSAQEAYASLSVELGAMYQALLAIKGSVDAMDQERKAIGQRASRLVLPAMSAGETQDLFRQVQQGGIR